MGKPSVSFPRSVQGRRSAGNTAGEIKISCVAAVGKKCDASTNQSNNFGVSHKRFELSTPGSNTDIRTMMHMHDTFE